VLYSIYARGVWINRFIYLESREEHGAAPLVQPHGSGVDCCHCIGTSGRLHEQILKIGANDASSKML
jgi:hypothetical protein